MSYICIHLVLGLLLFLVYGPVYGFRISVFAAKHKAGTNCADCTLFSDDVKTLKQLQDFAQMKGLRMDVRDYWVFLNIEIFAVEHPSSRLGYVNAFVQPGGVLHLGSRAAARNIFVSTLLGAYALLWGQQKGCTRAQLLAIYDSNFMHRCLCKLYQSYGFQAVKEIDGSIHSVLDRIIWGGMGSLMEANISTCLDVVRRNMNTRLKSQRV